MPTLSVVMACYNEADTLQHNLKQLLAIQHEQLQLEIIIVDDGSTDETCIIAHQLSAQHATVKLFSHTYNQGKGAALRTGFAQATGEYVVIHDADMEYDPRDLLKLLHLLETGQGDVAIGSRFNKNNEANRWNVIYRLANRFLTFLSNICSGLRISDMECCYKMFPREYLHSMQLTEPRFGIEPELIAKLAKISVNGKKLRFVETGVFYNSRSYAQGKKIGFRDGISAIRCIIKYNFFGNTRKQPALYKTESRLELPGNNQ